MHHVFMFEYGSKKTIFEALMNDNELRRFWESQTGGMERLISTETVEAATSSALHVEQSKR